MKKTKKMKEEYSPDQSIVSKRLGRGPQMGHKSLFFLGLSRIMFPRSIRIMSFDLGREGL